MEGAQNSLLPRLKRGRLYGICLLLFFPCLAVAQQYDYLWHFGNSNLTDTSYAGMTLNFFEDSLSITTIFRPTYFRQVNASMCDSSGNVLFYTNGIHVADATGGIMENGDSLNPGYFGDAWHDDGYGYVLNQGAIALPFPEKESQFILFHKDVELAEDYSDTWSQHLYVSQIDVTENGGLGRVKLKNIPLLDENLAVGKLTATRHANGRDWWLPIRRHRSNEYYWFLLGPNGVSNKGNQIIGDSIPSGGLGQAVFSPDGSKYAYLNLVGGINSEDYIAIYDVDRCTGAFTNAVQFTYLDSAACGGAAISPNSRFLYIMSCSYAYQYDLWADDIEASRDTIGVWDGFYANNVFATTFYLAQLAPDGKIYVNTSNGTRFLHVIENPDLPGDACNFIQRGVNLPGVNNFSMPNFPNYRLGHLEGSPCDTLRQPPTAAFSASSNGPDWAFTDESYHDIRTWFWTFGDGQSDTVAHPQHSYTEDGLYEVCLTVTNPRGEDTYSEEIAVLVDDTEDHAALAGIRVFPNPARDVLLVDCGDQLPPEGSFLLFDAMGRPVLHTPITPFQERLSISHLPAGVYTYEIRDGLVRLALGKVVKM